MRIGVVCPYSLDVPGGVGEQAMGEARWLAQEGHDVRLVAPGTRARAQPGVEVVTVGRGVGFRFNGSVARLAVAPHQVRRGLRAVAGADVIHVHEPLTPGLAYSVARRSGRLVVTHHTSFEVSAWQRLLLRRVAGGLPARSTIAVSAEAARVTAALGIRGAGIIPNAVDTAAWPIVDRPRREPPRIGFLGRRDEPRKGFEVFLRLAGTAGQAGLAGEFVVAGPGSREARGLTDAGELTDEARRRWLADLDVLVAPNLGGESFGVVLVEALAAGCDVVASALPAFDDVLRRAGRGATFTVGDHRDALRALTAVLGGPRDAATAHHAAAQWSWEAVGPHVLEVLMAAAGGADSLGDSWAWPTLKP